MVRGRRASARRGASNIRGAGRNRVAAAVSRVITATTVRRRAAAAAAVRRTAAAAREAAQRRRAIRREAAAERITALGVRAKRVKVRLHARREEPGVGSAIDTAARRYALHRVLHCVVSTVSIRVK